MEQERELGTKWLKFMYGLLIVRVVMGLVACYNYISIMVNPNFYYVDYRVDDILRCVLLFVVIDVIIDFLAFIFRYKESGYTLFIISVFFGSTVAFFNGFLQNGPSTGLFAFLFFLALYSVPNFMYIRKRKYLFYNQTFEEGVTKDTVVASLQTQCDAVANTNMEENDEMKSVDALADPLHFSFENNNEFITYISVYKPNRNVIFDSPDRYIELYNLAEASYEKGDYSTAIKQFEDCFAINPVAVNARFEISNCYVQMKDFANAKSTLSDLAKYLVDNSSKAKYYRSYGFIECELGNYKEAYVCYEISKQFENNGLADLEQKYIKSLAPGLNIRNKNYDQILCEANITDIRSINIAEKEINDATTKNKSMESDKLDDRVFREADFLDKKNNVKTEDIKPPVVRFCRKCGFKLIDGSIYCSKCGAKVQ